MERIDELERACVEQGARVASLKRDAREKESIDAAVSQLLEQKAALKAALEEMIHAAEASGDATGLPALQERLAPLLPKGKGKKKATCVPPAPPPQYPRPPTALPPGWTAVKDKQGDEYYWHQSSGQVTWDRPVS